MSQNDSIPGGYPDSEAENWVVRATAQQMRQPEHLPSPSSRIEMPQSDDIFPPNLANTADMQSNQDRLPNSIEEQDIAKAVEMSLKDQKDTQARAAESIKAEAAPPRSAETRAWDSDDEAGEVAVDSSNKDKESPVKKKPRNTIQDMVDNLALRLSNEFTPINDELRDTLVYIGPPAKTRDQTYSDYAHIKKHFDRFHHIDSRKLKVLNSEKLDQLLRPNACIFAEKRLKKLDAYKHVSQEVKDATKYHIDLRPPNEDEEAVILLTELSCSQGVRNWHLAQKKYGLPVTTVMGTDELDTKANPYYVDNVWQGRVVEDDDGLRDRRSDPSAISEYSALRHHSAVERLLQAIYHNDPKLDSAPKMWTFFAIAQYFKCAQHPSISKWISSWLTRAGNRNFVQNNPEVAYRIGMGIMDAELVRDAFSILVGEKTLIDICNDMSGRVPASPISVHGRRQENLDDDEQNRISHAASSLLHRMTQKYRSITVELEWINNSKEYQKLLTITGSTPVEEEIIQEAKTCLHRFVKGRFLEIVRMDLARPFSELDLNAAETAAFRHGSSLNFDTTYSQLHQEAKPFTRSLWMALSRARFQEGSNNTNMSHIAELQRTSGHLDEVDILAISREIVDNTILDVNEMLRNREVEAVSQPSPTDQYFQLGDQFFQLGDRATGSEPQTLAQQPPTGPLIELFESPKRASNEPDGFATSPGKRRKTMDGDTIELPYRPVNAPQQPPTPIAIQHANASHQGSEPIFSRNFKEIPKSPSCLEEGGIFETDNVTNQPVSPESRHTNLPRLAPRPQLHSRPMQNTMNSATGSTQNSNHWSAYVGDVDAETRLPVFKLKSASDVLAADAPQEEAKDVFLLTPEVNPVVPEQPWPFGEKRDTQFLPKNSQVFPPATGFQPQPKPEQVEGHHYSSQWQESAFATGSSTSIRKKAVQQFSNTNTPYAGRSYSREPSKFRDSPEAMEKSWTDPSHYPINPNTILTEFSAALIRECDDIIYPPHLFHGTDRLPVDLIDNLLNLDEAETKFLPLWAGGYDDGTGGVFDDMEVPNLEKGGFKGGKRGISNVDGMDSEGSVSGSENSFDDVASDAISTVGKASKAATDGTQTVKSLSENGDAEGDAGFMNQDDVYEVIQEMKMGEIREGKMRAAEDNEFDLDDDDDGDVSTIMGAGSDVQGHFFGEEGEEDVGSPFDGEGDDDDNDNDDDDDDDDGVRIDADVEGKTNDVDSEYDDMDMEVIDEADL